MRCVFLLSITIAACSARILKNPMEDYKEDDRYFYFSGDDGTLELIDVEEPVETAFVLDAMRNSVNNAYWLFTRSNPDNAQILYLNNTSSVMNSNFVASKTTIFLAHGWNGYGGNDMNKVLTKAFLQNFDVNVIVLDWNVLANKNYNAAKAATPAVGRSLGRFVNWLVNVELSAYSRIHLVGFSLGGHLVGNAGKETDSRVQRITALDPAGPLWHRDNERLLATDAQYVEVIHTNRGSLGFAEPCGDADFYPNGGSKMPGCWTNYCSHSQSYRYMAISVKYNQFFANECSTYRDAIKNRCTGTFYPMGNNDLNKSRHGIFRINTNKSYPY